LSNYGKEWKQQKKSKPYHLSKLFIPKKINMKKFIRLFTQLLVAVLLTGCSKNNTTLVPAAGKCKPLTEFSNFNASNVTYTYTYNADGTLAHISYPPVSMAVGYASTSITQPASVRTGLTDSLNTYYNANIFTGLPTEASQWITMDGITQSDYWNYKFSYDTKSRLIQVIESTPHVATDWEYKLSIFYNDQDNVTSLKYESITGPNTATMISATGYDDKPGPYSAIKNWQLFTHAAWNNYDPAPLFEALSKNNPLGYNITGDGVNASTMSRTMAYTYNENGFPIKRTNTNTNNAGTYSFDEVYTYQCE